MKKLIALLIIVSFLAMPTQIASHDARWNSKTGTIEADGIIVRFFEMRPHYIVWVPEFNNTTTAYHINFIRIVEFDDKDGDNAVDDSEVLAKAELTAKDLWSVKAENTTIDGVKAIVVSFEANISVFKTGMKGGIGQAYVAFINKIFLENYTLENGYEIAGGRELKIDIKIKDWPWVSENSKLALLVLIAVGDKEGHMEKAPETHMHQIQVRESNVRELRLNSTDTKFQLAFRWEEQVRLQFEGNETYAKVNHSILAEECDSIVTFVYPHFNGTLEHDPSIVALETEATEGEATEGGVGEGLLEQNVGGIPLIYLIALFVVAIVSIVIVIKVKR